MKSYNSPENAARERSRVKNLREAFHNLQAALPSVPPNTKLSKLDILILATNYIAHLTDTLDQSRCFSDHTFSRAGGYLHPVKVGWFIFDSSFYMLLHILVLNTFNCFIFYWDMSLTDFFHHRNGRCAPSFTVETQKNCRQVSQSTRKWASSPKTLRLELNMEWICMH